MVVHLPTLTLIDLPTELLYDICQRVDNRALLHLVLTCKTTHSICLDIFFSRHKTLKPFKNFISVDSDSPEESLRMIRADLPAKKRFSIIRFDFPLDNARLLKSISDLYDLVKQLDSTRHFEITLPMSRSQALDIRKEEKILEKTRWKKVFTATVDAVLARSCTNLTIESGESVHELYKEAEVYTTPLTLSSDGVKKRTVQRRRTAPRRNKLKELCIGSDMLLQPTFYDWTLSTVVNASATISHLDLNLLTTPATTWKAFLSALELPKLANFTILQPTCSQEEEDRQLGFEDVRSFLVRHPTITTLYLSGVENPSREDGRFFDTPILPNATKLITHSSWVSALLGDSGNAQRLPKIQEIDMTIGHLSILGDLSNPDYEPLNAALRHIAARQSQARLKIAIHFRGAGVAEWVAEQVTLGPAESVLAQLANVSSFTLDMSDVYLTPPELLESMPDFFKLLPNLDDVGLEIWKRPRMVHKLAFLKKMANACPMARRFRISDDTIDLSKFRDARS